MTQEYNIPEGYAARIESNKVIIAQKDSEDERIRKELIGHLKECRNNTRSEVMIGTYAKWLAYLEKQKEQKPTIYHKFKVGDTIHKIGENTVYPRTIEKIEDGDYVCNNDKCSVSIKFQDDYELVEQKPAEWSEKDKEIVGNLRHILNAYAFEHSGLDVNGDYIEQDYIDADNWLKSLRERVNIQPKFRIGDTIHEKGENTVFPMTIERISDGDYVCDGGKCFVSIKFQDNYELIQQEQPKVDLREVETGGIKGNLEEIPSNVDLEKEIEGTTGDYAEGRRLEQRILEESRRFPEVSFAKLSRIAKHFYDFGKQERFVEPQGLEEAAVQAHIRMEESREEMTFLNTFKAGVKWMFEKAPSEQAIAYVKAFHSASEVSEFQAAMNIAAAKAFDAGAKWMAEQGIVEETRIITNPYNHLKGVAVTLGLESLDFDDNEPVIVQIRKKEE